MKDFEKRTAPKKALDTESWFLESYRRHIGHPIRILISLYKGNYHKFVLAVICFFIKHACVWVLPILTANIINDVTGKNPNTLRNILFYAALEIGLIALNIPMNYLYTWLPAMRKQACGKRWCASCSSFPFPTMWKPSPADCRARSCVMWRQWRTFPHRCF